MADDIGARNLIKSERVPGRNYDLIEASNPARVQVDGVSNFMLGPALSRIDFHQLVRIQEAQGLDGQPLEIREQIISLIMPTMALAEFLGGAIKGLQDNQEMIVQAMGLQTQAFQQFISLFGKANADSK